MSQDEGKKNIDESWKEAVEKEKVDLEKGGQRVPPEPDFKFFISSLSLQASIALGFVPNPSTNKTEEDMAQAKFLIDTLDMLQVKTKGNLVQDEADLLENVLYELRLAFISKAKGELK